MQNSPNIVHFSHPLYIGLKIPHPLVHHFSTSCVPTIPGLFFCPLLFFYQDCHHSPSNWNGTLLFPAEIPTASAGVHPHQKRLITPTILLTSSSSAAQNHWWVNPSTIPLTSALCSGLEVSREFPLQLSNFSSLQPWISDLERLESKPHLLLSCPQPFPSYSFLQGPSTASWSPAALTCQCL